MFKLLKGATVYAPEKLGATDILIWNDRIKYMKFLKENCVWIQINLILTINQFIVYLMAALCTWTLFPD